MQDPNDRLARCERELRRLRITLGFALGGVATLALFALISRYAVRTANADPQTLRVSELVVVDDHGVERARLGGHLPDAVIRGKRAPRGGTAAGLLIYDATGQERGGYITFDEPSGNVLLTVDTREGQVAYLAAEPRQGVGLRLWTAGHSVEMRADSSGARFTGTRSGRVVTQLPPLSESEIAAECAGLKSEVAHLDPKPPSDKVLEACMQRMPEATCRECLGLPTKHH